MLIFEEEVVILNLGFTSESAKEEWKISLPYTKCMYKAQMEFLFFIYFSSFSFKLWKYDKIYRRLGKYRTKLHIVALYITIV